MGRFAALAEEHYRQWLPEAYAAIKDRPAFFEALEDEAHSQLENLEDAFIGPDPEDEAFAARLARYQWARYRAEEVVIREVLLTDPEVTAADRENARLEAKSNVELVAALDEFQRLLGELRDQQAN